MRGEGEGEKERSLSCCLPINPARCSEASLTASGECDLGEPGPSSLTVHDLVLGGWTFRTSTGESLFTLVLVILLL